MAKRSNGEMLCGAMAISVLCVIALIPLGLMLVRSVFGDGGATFTAYNGLLNGGRQWTLLTTSLYVAVGTAIIAALLGVPAGFALAYLRIPARRTLAFVFAVPVLVPPYIWTIAWIDLLGKQGMIGPLFDIYSIPGVVLVLAMAWYPLVALMTVLAIRRLDTRIEEAARLAVSPARTFFGVTLPIVLPGIVAGTGFVFLLALVNFAVPSLLQVSVYPVEIYTLFNAFHDFQTATATAVPMVLMVTVLLGSMAIFLRRKRSWFGPVHDHGRHPRRWTVPASVYCWILAAVSAVLPATALVRSSMPIASYVHAWQAARTEILHSVGLAAMVATMLVVLGFTLAYNVRHSGKVTAFLLRAGTLAPFAISGPVLGIGTILLWNRTGPAGAVYGSFIIVVIAVAARFIFFAEEGFALALRSIHKEIEEAAIVAGVPWQRRIWRLVIPFLYPSFAAVWGLAFVLAMQELAVTVLVSPPGVTTLPVRLFTLMHYGPNSMVSALCVLMTCVMLVAATVPALVYRRIEKVLNVRR